MVSLSHSLWRGFSIDESIQARLIDLHKAYSKQLLKSNKRHILRYRSWCPSSGSANSISGQPTLLFCQYQNALQENYSSNNSSPWSGWVLGHMRGLGTRTLPQRLPSPLKGTKFSVLLPFYYFPTAWGVIVLYLWYWRKDRQELFCFGCFSRIVKVGVGRRFYR